jgi:uncharacterized protein
MFPIILLVTLAGRPSHAAERELKEFLTAPATLALTAYQRFISPVKGTSCPMAPSDSGYAREALRRHGFWRGTLEAVDRLHRCGHDLDKYPLIETTDGLKYSDPLP